jgi:hypothetical protein
MKYHIINKIQYINNQMVYTPIGYTLNQSDADIINNKYQSFDDWVDNHISELNNGTISIYEYFDANPIIYNSHLVTDNIDNMGLTEIININEL